MRAAVGSSVPAPCRTRFFFFSLSVALSEIRVIIILLFNYYYRGNCGRVDEEKDFEVVVCVGDARLGRRRRIVEHRKNQFESL